MTPKRGSLVVVGTGLSVAGQVTQEALSYIEGAEKLLFLVTDVTTKRWLEGLNPSAESLYDSYAVGRPREETYAEMSERMLQPVRRGLRVVSAFYGHPGVFASPPHMAIARAREEGFDARMLPGVSAEDCLFADLGLDPGERGCQSYEATDFILRQRRFDSSSPLVLWQVGAIGVRDYRRTDLWNSAGLRFLQEYLLDSYPATHEVVVYEAAQYPVCAPLSLRVAISDLPGSAVTIRSTLYVPPLPDRPTDPDLLRKLESSLESP